MEGLFLAFSGNGYCGIQVYLTPKNGLWQSWNLTFAREERIVSRDK
jgi:hypothetical protein